MNYLLDTCALIWLGMGGGELSEETRRRISLASNLHYSSISDLGVGNRAFAKGGQGHHSQYSQWFSLRLGGDARSFCHSADR